MRIRGREATITPSENQSPKTWLTFPTSIIDNETFQSQAKNFGIASDSVLSHIPHLIHLQTLSALPSKRIHYLITFYHHSELSSLHVETTAVNFNYFPCFQLCLPAFTLNTATRVIFLPLKSIHISLLRVHQWFPISVRVKTERTLRGFLATCSGSPSHSSHCDISWNLSPPALQLRHCSSNTGLSKANLCLKYCIPAETSVQNILLPSIYPAQFLRYLLKCHLLGEA